MSETLEIAKYVIPSIVVFLTSWFTVKSFLTTKEELQRKELKAKLDELQLQNKREDKQQLIPIRLQAYERMVLFVERISPQSLIFRVQSPNQKVFQLQSALLKSIRNEYEHNLAQQLYISKESWAMLKTAKEDIVKLINNAAANTKPDDNAIELSKRIFEMSMGEKQNSEIAIEMLKKDIHKLF
jgi:hypothetical protein